MVKRMVSRYIPFETTELYGVKREISLTIDLIRISKLRVLFPKRVFAERDSGDVRDLSCNRSYKYMYLQQGQLLLRVGLLLKWKSKRSSLSLRRHLPSLLPSRSQSRAKRDLNFSSTSVLKIDNVSGEFFRQPSNISTLPLFGQTRFLHLRQITSITRT